MSDRKKTIPTTPKQLLFQAAEIIRERGHCKDVYSNTAGEVCYYGALYAALGRETNGRFVVDRVFSYDEIVMISRADKAMNDVLLGAGFSCYLGWLSCWNDRGDVKAQDVIDTMERAASKIND